MAVADKKNVEVLAALGRDKAALRAAIDKSLITERDHQERQLELERAEAALTVARADHNSEREAAALDIKLKKVEVVRAERELAEVEKAIAKLSIAAPVDGVAMVNTHPWTGQKLVAGETIWVGWAIVTLPNLTDLIIRANLSDVDDGQVVAGMKARVVFDADPTRALAGTVRKTSDIALEMGGEALRRAFDVVVELDDKGQGWARPGMSARVEVTSRTLEDALLVPRDAIRWVDGKSLVLLEGGKEVPVTFEACDAQRCALAVDTAGISAGAQLRVRPEGDA